MEIFFTIIWFILTIFTTAYCLNYILLIVMAKKGRSKDLKRKNLQTSVQRHITVIIYAETVIDSLINLIGALQNQNYPADKYNINIVLEEQNPNSEKILALINHIKIWKLSNTRHNVGFFPSIAKAIEKNMATQYTNGFVILNSTNTVKNNFLERVNISLDTSPISQACVATTSPYASLYNSIGYIHNRILNRAKNAGKFHLNLGSDLLSSGLIVTQEFLEKHPINIDKTQSEIDYNYYLLAEKVNINWAPEVIVFNKIAEDIQDLCIWKAKSTIMKIKSVFHNAHLIFKNLGCFHFTLHLLCPNKFIIGIITLITIFAGYLASLKLLNIDIWLYIPLLLLIVIIILDLPAMAVSKSSKKDYKIWLTSFFSYFPETLITAIYTLKLWGYESQKQYLPHFSLQKETIELHKPSYTKEIEVFITDGTKKIQCSLEIKSERNENQIALIFKNKKYSSNKHQTLDRCFEEINNKLEKYNFTLINCFNCGYFSFSNQSHEETSGTEGHCFYNKEGQHLQFDDTIKIWHSCDCYCPLENRIEIIKKWKDSLPQQTNTIIEKID